MDGRRQATRTRSLPRRRDRRVRRCLRRAPAPAPCTPASRATIPASCQRGRSGMIGVRTRYGRWPSRFQSPATTAVPDESSTFSGLMSRWTIPCPCAYDERASNVAKNVERFTEGEPARGDSRAKGLAVDEWHRCSVLVPSASPAVSTGTRLACWSRAATCTSRAKRSALRSHWSSGARLFTTIVAVECDSSATNTRDMPAATELALDRYTRR